MATHTNLSSLFTDIADSIRSVSGGTASIQADTFPTAIQSLGSGFAKIQTGSYVGTGTYGASNPCSLTFEKTPYQVMITTTNISNYPLSYEHFGLWFTGATVIINEGVGSVDSVSIASITNNSLSWYTTYTYANPAEY